MTAAYQPAAWFDFYFALAGVCAALWGLLFVAISLHPLRVSEHPVLRNRARVNLLGLWFQLVIALVCLIPQQSPSALGLELGLLWLLWIGSVSVATLQVVRRLGQVHGDFWLRAGAAVLIGLCGIAVGVTLRWGSGGGLLWNVVANVVGLLLTLANAWSMQKSWSVAAPAPHLRYYGCPRLVNS